MYVAWSFCSFCFAKNFFTCTLRSYLISVGQLNNAFKRVFTFTIEQSEGKLDLRFFKGSLMKPVLFYYYYYYALSILSARDEAPGGGCGYSCTSIFSD